MKRPLQPHFSRALRQARRARGMSQEGLDVVSGRTYISALERGVKQPTLGKVSELASALGVHPLTLLTLSFCSGSAPDDVERLQRRVAIEVAELSGLAA